MITDIVNRCALITGASRGMGKSVAFGLANEGVNVCLVARNEQDLFETAQEIKSITGVSVTYIVGDVSKSQDITFIFNHAINYFGKIDILVNNAGGPKPGGLLSISEEDWNDAINLTLRSMIRFTRISIPGMIERKWGRIVTITSTVAKEPSPSMILSATMRAGVTSFTKALSTEMAPYGITINTVEPGGVLTDRLRTLLEIRSKKEGSPFEQLLQDNQNTIPIGRYASPDEISDFVVFLCSERSKYITGTALCIDGGLTKGIF